MTDGWVCVDEAMPRVGDKLEILLSRDCGGYDGGWEGTLTLMYLPTDPDDWTLTNPKGEVMWVRYWRKMQ